MILPPPDGHALPGWGIVFSMVNAVSLSTQIKAARGKLGLSQAKAAAAWNVPLKTLQKWEAGTRQPQGLALSALQEKLAAVGATVASPEPGPPSTSQSQGVEAPEEKGVNSILTPVASDPPPPPESAPADQPADPRAVGEPWAAVVEEDNGSKWQPPPHIALAVARYRETIKTRPAPVWTRDDGW